MIETLPSDLAAISTEELIRLRESRISTVKTIQLQLSDNDRKNEYGERMNAIEWSRWRYKANGAVRAAEADLQALKAEIRVRATAPKPDSATQKRPEVYSHFAKLADALADWPDAPQPVVTAARNLRAALDPYLRPEM